MRMLSASLTLFVLLFLLSFPISATPGEELIDKVELEEFLGSLPEDVDELEDVEDIDGLADAVGEMSGVEYIIKSVLDALGLEFGAALMLFLAICALLVLSAVFNTSGASAQNSALSSAIRFCSVGGLFSTVVYMQYKHFSQIEVFFDSLGKLMNSIIPMTATVWAMGGNVSNASVGSASFYVMLAISERLFRSSVLPVCCVMSVLGLCDAMSDEMRLGKMLGAIKKIYAFFLGIVITLLLSSLGAQTAILASADSAAARTARMLSGSFIPILGGSVGETLRTVSGGVSYLKNIFGIGGIIMIFSLLLPVAVSLLLARIVFLISAGIAEVLGCANEARMLENLGEVYGTMLAVAVSVSVMFILSLCIFVQSAVAVA